MRTRVAVAAIIATLLGVGGWSFRWEYAEVTRSTYPFVEKEFVRTNRFTGESERLTRSGWVSIGSYSAPPIRTARPAPSGSVDPYDSAFVGIESPKP